MTIGEAAGDRPEGVVFNSRFRGVTERLVNSDLRFSGVTERLASSDLRFFRVAEGLASSDRGTAEVTRWSIGSDLRFPRTRN